MTEITHVPTALIVPGDNDRRVFAARELRALAESIKTHGLAQPITVRPIADGHYQIVAGERRWRAHRLAGLETVACIIRDDLDDAGAAAIMLLENVHRADLNPLDEAYAYHKRMEEFEWTVEEVARRANVSAGRVKNRVVLLDLVPEVQKLIGDGQLSPGYGVAMSPLDSNRQRIALRYLREANRPNLREFNNLCGELLAEQAKSAMFDMDDFMQTVHAVEADDDARVKARRFPVADDLPEVDAPNKGSVGLVIETYIAKLLDAGEDKAAAAIGKLYEGLLKSNWTRPPRRSPLDT